MVINQLYRSKAKSSQKFTSLYDILKVDPKAKVQGKHLIIASRSMAIAFASMFLNGQMGPDGMFTVNTALSNYVETYPYTIMTLD